MFPLYNRLAILMGRIHFASRGNAALDAKRLEAMQTAEDLLARALQKQGIAPEVAQDSALHFVAGVLKRLADADALHESTAAGL